MKRLFGLALAISAVLGMGIFLLSGNRIDRLLTHRLSNQLNDQPDFRDDALHAFICGSSSPVASLKRAQACIGVVADGRLLLFDVGAGSWRSLQSRRVPPQLLSDVFITHFHSDHFGDLGEANIQSWIWGRSEPIAVYGPPGIVDLTEGFDEAYDRDQGVRNGQAGEALMPMAAAKMKPRVLKPGGEVIDLGSGLTVTAFPVEHVVGMIAMGYRVDYKGRSVLISGDTMYAERLVSEGQGVDLLFHEAYSERFMSLFTDAVNEGDDERLKTFVPRFSEAHTSVEEVRRVADETDARMTVLYHLLPPVDGAIGERLFAKSSDDFQVGNDGDWFILAANSESIQKKRLD